MFKQIKYLFGLILLLSVQQVVAQNEQLAALLRPLTQEQKIKYLAYIRALSDNDLDQEIQCAYDQLPQIAQMRALQYVESVQPITDGKPSRTTVRWNRDTLRFGIITEGAILLDSFLITNTGSRPYAITGYQSSCDCTVLKIPTQPLLPGETTAIRIEFNSKGKSGKVQAAIVLQDNSSPNARTILSLSGIVQPLKTNKKRPWED